MIVDWARAGPTATAAFLASAVEFVEALTVVLAVGAVRGWRGALIGSGGAVVVLLAIVAVLGPALTRIPLEIVQLAVGTLLLLFGMRWLRKAILRSAGVIPLHDEGAAYVRETESLRRLGAARATWDTIAIATAFKITMLEGLEVVFIVIAVGAGGVGLLIPASAGALAALVLVVFLGIAVYRPLASVPENSLKFAVGVLLTAFGAFWVGEGIGLDWPGRDWSILWLVAGFFIVALLTVLWRRTRAGVPTAFSNRQQRRMPWLKAVIVGIIGLFVDDGLFALAILVWVGAARLVLPRLGASAWSGVVLFAGLALILAESAGHRARR
jgi:uncharacterized membrane protein